MNRELHICYTSRPKDISSIKLFASGMWYFLTVKFTDFTPKWSCLSTRIPSSHRKTFTCNNFPIFEILDKPLTLVPSSVRSMMASSPGTQAGRHLDYVPATPDSPSQPRKAWLVLTLPSTAGSSYCGMLPSYTVSTVFDMLCISFALFANLFPRRF